MRSSTTFGVALLCAALTLGAGSAAEQPASAPGPSHPATVETGLNFGKHDANAPISINSDNFEGDFTTKVGTYTGNVVMTQADYKMRADRVKVDVVEGKVNKLEAAGKVVFDSPSGTALGDNGIYDLSPPRTITLTGHVTLTKQKNVMRGTTLVVNMVTGLAHLTAQGMPGNRVQSVFVPRSESSGTKSGDESKK